MARDSYWHILFLAAAVSCAVYLAATSESGLGNFLFPLFVATCAVGFVREAVKYRKASRVKSPSKPPLEDAAQDKILGDDEGREGLTSSKKHGHDKGCP